MEIYHDVGEEVYKKESCKLTANLDSNMAPSEGLTVVYSEYHDCTLKNGDYISYTPPEMDPPTTAGAVSI